ncbi:ATP-dependent helicase HrpA [Prosthecobacter fusiformis]|uniref:ATP-dependent helicase HrpA n=1 Tax=Prosthecobacter fusiformis TaxID=48464 RepID=A0A4R7SQD0_9BACT|nr:ATP-dependent RNA helicase HrpA [Prosthecobacter fusiformis]TDU80845.1 ATP-dependent helicase HrpA [Prosthecobacter fusiformis]
MIRYPADLPITARREDILAAIRSSQVVILAGETGSGKTTQLPKMCLEVLLESSRLRQEMGLIGCTQPRRVAAMSVSKRVAEELDVQWGREVGCKMRFADDTTRETRIKFMTDGILLAEIQSDPLLRAYSIIILDEAHERSLNIDFLLGYLKTLLEKRPDLKLVVTSATIDTEAFSAHFGSAPIIEVSGRLYPVDIRYKPVGENDDDPSHLDAAIAAVEEVLLETDTGDVLVFMPTERDIRDTRDALDGRLGKGIEVLALFGRMASHEQQRVFSPGSKRRVIIATNVAETSITLPRIRYVVDTGLARMSRYNPRTRTKRLPVEAISQSSANQRAGRAGRVQDGICIRLYEEEDFNKRSRFTQPEIQRSNLAEVILRMKAFRLGEIETFPFINPPVSASIRAGYDLLHELGALGETHEMTATGRELANLPLDPTLGRMLLQAREEGCLEDMLIIAAGLSIPDPRERPEEKREQCQAAHKTFASPESDFLSLLKIWNHSPDPENSGKNALRKYCKSYFLSFTRMTEWRDVWHQLRDTFKDDRKKASSSPPQPVKAPSNAVSPWEKAAEKTARQDEASSSDHAIHRCILAGHLGHIATRLERNQYKAAGNREVMVFPGSNLYERREKQGKQGQEKTRQPLWIVAGEIVQTSQLFARSIARIDPQWAAELGAHLVERRYSEPHWSAKAGRVLVTERLLLHGLEVKRQPIDFGKIDPVAATQLFIRGALLEGTTHLPHRFFQHNQKLRDRLEATLTRVRSSRVYAIEEHLFEFYRARLEAISSVHDLNKLVNARVRDEPGFLCAREEDLTGGDDLSHDLEMFPDAASMGNSVLPITYAYKPGQEDDGVTVQVPQPMAEHLTSGQVLWMVPGLREEQITTLLRALPKTVRRDFMPLEVKAREIAKDFDPGRGDFHEALAEFLRQRYRLQVKATDWDAQTLPAYLQPRVEVMGQGNKAVMTSRDVDSIRETMRKQEQSRPSDAWDKTAKRFEDYALSSWSFGDIPETVLVETIHGVPVLGHPGLVLRDGEVDLRLFKQPEEARKQTPAAVRKLAENLLGKDIAWLHKELRILDVKAAPQKTLNFQSGLAALGSTPAANAPAGNKADAACDHILAHALRLEPLLPLTQKRFIEMCERTRRDLPALTHRVRDLLKQTEELRQKILAFPKRYSGLEQDLARLLPPNLLSVTPHAQLQHLPRYLKTILLRAERAANNPAKDLEKAACINDFNGWEQEVSAANRETFRWLFEEYRVSIFAQELGTAQPVSVKRLEALLG